MCRLWQSHLWDSHWGSQDTNERRRPGPVPREKAQKVLVLSEVLNRSQRDASFPYLRSCYGHSLVSHGAVVDNETNNGGHPRQKTVLKD